MKLLNTAQYRNALVTRRFVRPLQHLLASVVLVGLGARLSANEILLLEIARDGSNVRLSWTNTGAVLESALNPTGAWTQVTGAISGHSTSPLDLAGFFRLRSTLAGPGFEHLYVAPSFTTSIGDPIGCPCSSPENPNSLAGGGNAQANAQGSVWLHTGELTQHAVDLEIPGRGLNWRFERQYRSGMNYDGPLGYGWDFSHNRRLAADTNGHVLRMDGLGRADRYLRNTNGTFESPSGFYTRLNRNQDGTFEERDRHGVTHYYSPTNGLGIARLSRISDRNGNQMMFQYNPAGQLTNVIDSLERNIAYRYDANGRLTNLTDFTGRALGFAYDGNGNLMSATSPSVTGTPNGNDFPAGKTTLYAYASGFGDARFNHNLLSVTAPNEVAAGGSARLAAEYNNDSGSPHADRLVAVRLGGTNATGVAAGGTITYTYTSLGPAGANDFATAVFQNTVTNRNGNVSEYRFNQLGNTVRVLQFTRGLRAGEPAGYTNTFAYNRDGETVARTNAELDSVLYTFDSNNPDRLQQGNLLQTRRLPGPRVGDQPQLLTSRTYETNFNFVATSTDARGAVTTHRYDARGNCTNTVHRIPSIGEDFGYNQFGQLTTHVLPANAGGHRRRDVMTYYSSTIDPQNGYLQSRVIDSGGLNLTTTYQYDARGNVIRVTDPRGNDSLNLVNALNQAVRVISRPAPGGIRFTNDTYFDANNNVVRTVTDNRDENGVPDPALPAIQALAFFDILNNIITNLHQISATQYISNATVYDRNQNRILTLSGEAAAGGQPNNMLHTTQDERDLVFRQIRAPGSSDQSTTQYDYDLNGNLVRTAQGTEDAGGQVTTFAYDGYDRRAVATNAMGNVTTMRYDANGNVVTNRVDGQLSDSPGSAGNTNLAQTVYIYDAMDRLIRSDVAFFDTQTRTNIGDGLATMQTIYAPNSQVVTVNDDGGHGQTNTYDSANRLSMVIDPKGNWVAYTYDSNGNATAIMETDKSDLGNPDQTFTNRFVYDQLDRMTQQLDDLGNTLRYSYDSRGNIVLLTDANTNKTQYVYDGLSRLLRTCRDMNTNGVFTNVADIFNEQTYDDNSRLTSRTDDNTNTTRYAYDSLDRLIVTRMADGTLDQVGTGATWPLGSPEPNLAAFSSGYDVHDRPIRRLDANGTRVDSIYDLLNRLLTNHISRATGVLGTTNELYRYDGLSRIIMAQDDDSTVSRAYDSLSNVTTEMQRLQLNPTRTVRATYDSDRNQTRLMYPGGRVIERSFDSLHRPLLVRDGPAGPTVATYAYIGHRLEQRDTTNDAASGVAIRFEPSYDALRRVIRTTHIRLSDAEVLDDRTTTWDAADNRLSVSNNVLSQLDGRRYIYDAANRLVRSSGSPYWPVFTYSLDGAGNRTLMAGGPDAGSYTREATLPEPADSQMNQYTATPLDSRQYDARGNLTGTAGQIAGASRQIAYDYRKQIVSIADSVTGSTATYRYDAFGRRLEKNVDGLISRFYYDDAEEIEQQSSGNTTVATYVHSKGKASLLQMTRVGQRYYLHEDYLGGIVKVTDSTGSVVDHTEYSDYGKPFSPGAPQRGDLVTVYDSDFDPSPNGNPYNLADDFWFPASAQVTGITWRGGYDYATNAPSPDFFVIRFYTSSSNGLPDALIYENYVGQVTRTNTGRFVCCAAIGQAAEYEYQLTLFSPIFLQGNTRYWLSIVNNTSGTESTWGWETSRDGNGRSTLRTDNVAPWLAVAGDLAFQLVSGQTNSGNPFLYRACRFDTESGFILAGRYLDPAAGRFTIRGQSVLGNLFIFARNNPISAGVDDGDCMPPRFECGEHARWRDQHYGPRPPSTTPKPSPAVPIEIVSLGLSGGAGIPSVGQPGKEPPPPTPVITPEEPCCGKVDAFFKVSFFKSQGNRFVLDDDRAQKWLDNNGKVAVKAGEYVTVEAVPKCDPCALGACSPTVKMRVGGAVQGPGPQGGEGSIGGNPFGMLRESAGQNMVMTTVSCARPGCTSSVGKFSMFVDWR